MHQSSHNIAIIRYTVATVIVLLLCGVAGPLTKIVKAASTAAEIQQKIDENNKKIEDIQKQIDQYSTLLNSTSKQASTLKSALSTLELTQKKLDANLALTSTQISKTTLTLEELNGDIAQAEKEIASSSTAISRTIKDMNSAESESGIEQFIQNRSLSDAFDYINALKTIEGRIKIELSDMRQTRMLLGAKRDQALGESTRLKSYQKTLADQTKVVASNKAAKDQLLKDTQNQESQYKRILAEKVAQREAYEKELFNYESQLKVTVDPSAIPGARTGVLSWPLDKVVITQVFGKTVAAKRLYTSGTHGGIDFGASIGTKVMASLAGTVVDTEAVKTKAGCQYGKWVLIRHSNGLTTIYGHLSVVSVSPGDKVTTGETIGYSGATGYATGPHLHFGVYASAGVRIVDSSSLGSNKCAGIKTVAANPTTYLDPQAYLPKP